MKKQFGFEYTRYAALEELSAADRELASAIDFRPFKLHYPLEACFVLE